VPQCGLLDERVVLLLPVAMVQQEKATAEAAAVPIRFGLDEASEQDAPELDPYAMADAAEQPHPPTGAASRAQVCCEAVRPSDCLANCRA
jgi:hypothetical protein